jgi:PAS domain S-box-containing protein
LAPTNDPVRVLYVDGDPTARERTAEQLDRRAAVDAVTTAESGDEGLATLDREPVDCVVSAHDPPEPDGLAFLEAVRERDSELPFVLFTNDGSEALASEAISAGVTDYIRRADVERYDRLAERLLEAVETYRSRRAMAERNRQLETLTSNLPGIVYRCANAPGWPMTYVDGECQALVGYPPAAIEDGEVSWGDDILHPEDRERAWEVVQNAIEDGEPFELTYRVIDRDGDVRWAWERGRAVDPDDGEGGTGDGGEPEVLEGFITEVTERKEREQQLREEREFTETIMNAFDDIVYVFDAAGNFLRWNDRATEVSGYTDEELAEMGPTDVVADEHVDRIADSIGEIFESGRSTVEADLVMADGTRVPYEFRGRALTDEDGEPWGFCGIARDISERRGRERELEARNERLDEFASVVSHDLRNPLSVAEGHLDLAAQECDSEHLDAVERAHDRMGDLIEDLLTLAREGETVTDLSAVPLETVAMRAWSHVDTAAATLAVGTDRAVRADEGRLQRLFENLMRNAIEHAGDDPTVTVDTLPDDDGFYLADDGPGIPPDARDRVLEPGYSTDQEGTGFGLAIVRRIAEAHDWDVTVDEREGGGTRIEFRGVAFE